MSWTLGVEIPTVTPPPDQAPGGEAEADGEAAGEADNEAKGLQEDPTDGRNPQRRLLDEICRQRPGQGGTRPRFPALS
jgi:hypothetical protein